MTVSCFQYKLTVVYILYRVGIQTRLDLCDPKRSHPVNTLALLILGNWVSIYRVFHDFRA